MFQFDDVNITDDPSLPPPPPPPPPPHVCRVDCGSLNSNMTSCSQPWMYVNLTPSHTAGLIPRPCADADVYNNDSDDCVVDIPRIIAHSLTFASINYTSASLIVVTVVLLVSRTSLLSSLNLPI